LLSQEKVLQLRDQYPRVFDAEIVAIKSKRLTVTLQMQLWKLQGYLAQHRAIIAEHNVRDFDEDSFGTRAEEEQSVRVSRGRDWGRGENWQNS